MSLRILSSTPPPLFLLSLLFFPFRCFSLLGLLFSWLKGPHRNACFVLSMHSLWFSFFLVPFSFSAQRGFTQRSQLDSRRPGTLTEDSGCVMNAAAVSGILLECPEPRRNVSEYEKCRTSQIQMEPQASFRNEGDIGTKEVIVQGSATKRS